MHACIGEEKQEKTKKKILATAVTRVWLFSLLSPSSLPPPPYPPRHHDQTHPPIMLKKPKFSWKEISRRVFPLSLLSLAELSASLPLPRSHRDQAHPLIMISFNFKTNYNLQKT